MGLARQDITHRTLDCPRPHALRRAALVACTAALAGALALCGCQSTSAFTLKESPAQFPEAAQHELSPQDTKSFEAIPQLTGALGARLSRGLSPYANASFSPFAALAALQTLEPAFDRSGKDALMRQLAFDPRQFEGLSMGVAYSHRALFRSSGYRLVSLLVAPKPHGFSQDLLAASRRFSQTGFAVVDFANVPAAQEGLRAFARAHAQTIVRQADPLQTSELERALVFTEQEPLLLEQVQFSSAWNTPFSDKNEQRLFHGVDREGMPQDRETAFLVGQFKAPYAQTDDYLAVNIPLQPGSSIALYLPKGDKSPTELVGLALKTSNWATFTPGVGIARVPCVDMTATADLRDLMTKAGISSPFDSGEKPLVNFYTNKERTALGAYAQVSRIVIDREGVSSGRGEIRQDLPEIPSYHSGEEQLFDLTFDRPFAYVIVSNNIPVLAGTIYGM